MDRIDLFWAGALEGEVRVFQQAVFDGDPRAKREVLPSGGALVIGEVSGRRIAVGAIGAGKCDAASGTASVLCRYEVLSAVIAGISGAVKRGYQTGDLVIVDRVAEADWDLSAFGMARGVRSRKAGPWIEPDQTLREGLRRALPGAARVATGSLLTADRFINQKVWDLDPALAEIGGDICDMETAAFARVCSQFKVPWASVRIVSDYLGEGPRGGFGGFMNRSGKRLGEIGMKITGFFGDDPGFA